MSSSPPANPPSVINCVYYDGGSSLRHDVPLDQIGEMLRQNPSGFVWIGLYEPEDAILDLLQQEFDLHDLAIEDASNAHQRPKAESYGHSLFVVAHTAQMAGDRIHYGETHLFLGARYLVSVRHGASHSYAATRTRIERDPDLLRMGPACALYAILDSIVDNYLPIVDSFRNTLQILEKDILSDTYRRETVMRLYDLKRELTNMRAAVGPLQDMLAQMMRAQGALLIPREVRPYLRDVHDHAVRINDTIDILRDMLGTALNVNLALATLAQGENVKRLGAWAALLAVPTLITSWYGMNFHNMPELDHRYAYPILLGVIVTLCVGLYWVFKRSRWL